MTPERDGFPSDTRFAQVALAHDAIAFHERRARVLRLAAWSCLFRWLAARLRRDQSRLAVTTAA